MTIFGSYIDKSRSLTGEALYIVLLDTVVALMAGLIIFPACFALDVDAGSRPRPAIPAVSSSCGSGSGRNLRTLRRLRMFSNTSFICCTPFC